MEIETVSFPAPWSKESYLYDLGENKLSYYVGCFLEGKLLGYAGVWIILDEGHISNVAVHPDYRRKGIAEKLVMELVEALKKRDSRCLTLEVRASNEPARALYEKLGFVQVGLRKNYYRNPREDALILRKEF